MTSQDDARASDPLEQILTLNEAEQISGISAHTFAQQAEKGRLHARKVGHTWITTLGWLKAYLHLHARRARAASSGDRSERGALLDRKISSSVREPEGRTARVAQQESQMESQVRPMRILVAVDGSQESTRACRSAVALSRQVGASITILHVAQPHLLRSSFDRATQWREAEEAAREAGEQIVEEARILCGSDAQCTTEVLFGEPAATICRRARELNTDLIVVGSRGLNAIKRLVLGSVSAAVSNGASCSVLVVRERQRVSP